MDSKEEVGNVFQLVPGISPFISSSKNGIGLRFSNERNTLLNGTLTWTMKTFRKDGHSDDHTCVGFLEYGLFYVAGKGDEAIKTWGRLFDFSMEQNDFVQFTVTFERSAPKKERSFILQEKK